MLYVRSGDLEGRIIFTPIHENNVYMKCDICGKLESVSKPARYIFEQGAELSADSECICADCIDTYRETKERLKQEYPELSEA